MSNRQPEQMAELTIKALQLSGRRGVMLTGWHGLNQATVPAHVFKIDSVPHDWLFPHMAALVHHGGSSTTGAAFRAGIPQIVVPFSFEQLFWGERTESLGVGTKPIRCKQLTADMLAIAIGQAVAVIEQWLPQIPSALSLLVEVQQ